MTDDEFLAAFEATTVPREVWTHEAHVRVAWLYLSRRAFADALEAVRGGIRNLGRAFGKPEAYHDTITVAFVRLIADRLRPGDDYPAFRDRNPDLLDRTLPALSRCYSGERLDTLEARRKFVAPDLEPLPECPPPYAGSIDANSPRSANCSTNNSARSRCVTSTSEHPR